MLAVHPMSVAALTQKALRRMQHWAGESVLLCSPMNATAAVIQCALLPGPTATPEVMHTTAPLLAVAAYDAMVMGSTVMAARATASVAIRPYPATGAAAARGPAAVDAGTSEAAALASAGDYSPRRHAH